MRERAINDLCYIPSWVWFNFFVASKHAPLSTTQFSQTLFPHWTELNLDFQTIHKVLTVGWLKFCKVTRKKFCKDLSEIPEKKGGLSFSRSFTRWRLNTTYLLTFAHVVWSASLLCLSIDSIVSSIFTLSFSTIAMFFFKSASFFSTLVRIDQNTIRCKKKTTHLSIIFITLGLIFFFIPLWFSSSSFTLWSRSFIVLPPQSYWVPGLPNWLQKEDHQFLKSWKERW